MEWALKYYFFPNLILSIVNYLFHKVTHYNALGEGNALMIFNGAPHNPGIIYMVNVPVEIATDNLLTEICFKSVS